MLHNYSGLLIADVANYIDKIAIAALLGYIILAEYQIAFQLHGARYVNRPNISARAWSARRRRIESHRGGA